MLAGRLWGSRAVQRGAVLVVKGRGREAQEWWCGGRQGLQIQFQGIWLEELGMFDGSPLPAIHIRKQARTLFN